MLSPEISASKQAFRPQLLPFYHNPSKSIGQELEVTRRSFLDPGEDDAKPYMLLETFWHIEN